MTIKINNNNLFNTFCNLRKKIILWDYCTKANIQLMMCAHYFYIFGIIVVQNGAKIMLHINLLDNFH